MMMLPDTCSVLKAQGDLGEGGKDSKEAHPRQAWRVEVV